MAITAWGSLSEFQSNPSMVHSDGEWQDRDSLLPRVFFSPWIPVKSQIVDRRQTRKSVNSVLWPVFLPFWHSPFCWPPKLLWQTNCITEGPLHFLGRGWQSYIFQELLLLKIFLKRKPDHPSRQHLPSQPSRVDASQENSSSRRLNIELVEHHLLPCLFQQTAKDSLAREETKSPHHLSDNSIPIYHHGDWKAVDGSKSGFIFRFPDCACSCQKSLVQSLFKSTIKMSNGVNDLWISSKHCALILALGLAGDSLWEGCPVKRQFSQNWNFQGEKHPDFEPSSLSQ